VTPNSILSPALPVVEPSVAHVSDVSDRLRGAQPSHMPFRGTVAQPIGATLFCLDRPNERSEQQAPTLEVAMTPELWNEPALDTARYPPETQTDPGSTVCVARELRAVRPRKASSTDRARMASWVIAAHHAVTKADIRHLVLVIDTTEGDWMLDNLRADIVRWEDLPYRWIARQQ